MFKFVIKLFGIMSVALIFGILAADNFPPQWRSHLDNVTSKICVGMFSALICADILICLWVAFADWSKQKFIRVMGTGFLGLGILMIGSPAVTIPFAEAKIKARFEQALVGKNLNMQLVKAEIDASLRDSRPDHLAPALPYFVLILVGLLAFTWMYGDTKVNAKPRKGQRGAGR